jgi:hypothetical protein
MRSLVATIRRYYLPSSALVLSLLTAPAFGVIHFTLQGSATDSHFGLQTQSSRSASASIATDLGTYFRLGITHREDISDQEGHSPKVDGSGYYYSKTRTNLVANSLDLTIILYYGELFVPYIMGGVIKKDYITEFTAEDGSKAKSPSSFPLVPNAGVGLGIRINKDFSLKLSYTVSPGSVQDGPEDSVGRAVLDKVTSVGITYDL